MPDPREVHNTDQFVAFARTLAAATAAFREELISKGVSLEDASFLTGIYLHSVMRPRSNGELGT
jgi:hypothetical protein